MKVFHAFHHQALIKHVHDRQRCSTNYPSAPVSVHESRGQGRPHPRQEHHEDGEGEEEVDHHEHATGGGGGRHVTVSKFYSCSVRTTF